MIFKPKTVGKLYNSQNDVSDKSIKGHLRIGRVSNDILVTRQ